MKQNEDGKTVRAMDVLFPISAKIIGGSERERTTISCCARIEGAGYPYEGYVVVS